VIEMLLAPMISALPNFATIINYADNFLVMARTKKDAVSMINALWAALISHPVGPLKPKTDLPLGKHKNFDFLGFEFSQKKGLATVAPSSKNFHEFNSRFIHDLNKSEHKNLTHAERKQILKKLKVYVKSWVAAFHPWAEANQFWDEKLFKINQVSE
jgi:hypothetical protein